MVIEDPDWDACWVCKRTKEDIERLFDPLMDADYFEERNWENYNEIKICPVCNDYFNYLFWARVDVYFRNMSDLITDNSPQKIGGELWHKKETTVKREHPRGLSDEDLKKMR